MNTQLAFRDLRDKLLLGFNIIILCVFASLRLCVFAFFPLN